MKSQSKREMIADLLAGLKGQRRTSHDATHAGERYGMKEGIGLGASGRADVKSQD